MNRVSEFERGYNQAFEFTLQCIFAVGRAAAWVWEQTPGQWEWWWRALLIAAVLFIVPRLLRLVFGRLWDAIRGIPRIFGGARFASVRELRRAGLLKPGGRFLGQLRGRDIFMHGEGHCLTIAAQGSGKTTGLIIPTLITYRTGSVIVTDPKGAITAQTRRLRGEFSQVVVLSPWCDELKGDPNFGLDLGDNGFNPLQLVDGPGARTAAATLSGLLLPSAPGAVGNDDYFKQEGRELLEWGMLYQAAFHADKPRTLPALHALIYNSPLLIKEMQKLAVDKSLSGDKVLLRPGAFKFSGMAAMGAGAQLAGILGSAATALKVYEDGSLLARHVSKDGFKLADIKGEKPMTVYLICPPEHLISDNRQWLNLTLALIMQQIGKPGRARETVLLMDEFPAFKYLPNLLPSLEQFREAGLRAHLIAQNPGQIIQEYGQDGFRRLMGAAEYKQFFRITDPEQARLLSDWLGQTTVRTENRSAKGETSTGLAGVPLIRPEELSGMRRDRQILIRPEGRPVRGNVLPFFRRKEWAAQVEANPYRP